MIETLKILQENMVLWFRQLWPQFRECEENVREFQWRSGKILHTGLPVWRAVVWLLNVIVTYS